MGKDQKGFIIGFLIGGVTTTLGYLIGSGVFG